MPELDFVASESRTGVSIVSVNIKESYKEMRPIWDSLRRKVESVQDQLPSDAETPIVNDEFGDVFGTIVTLTGEDRLEIAQRHFGNLCVQYAAVEFRIQTRTYFLECNSH